MTTFDLSLNGDALNSFKQDFNSMLASTIHTMQQKEVEKATITAKFEIVFPEGVSSEDPAILYPTITHKISATMQFKSEITGFLGGPDFELFWDKASASWQMRKISEQRTLFDVQDDYPYEKGD